MRAVMLMPVGQSGVDNLRRIVAVLPDYFDLIIPVYDDTDISEFSPEYTTQEKMQKWGYAMKYAEILAGYDFIFIWDDDLVISDGFDFNDYIEIMVRNGIECSQPALTPDSFYSHGITLRTGCSTGRFTDFVEIMCPVYSRLSFREMTPYLSWENPWGWGYDFVPCSCGRKAIIDKYPVTHTRPTRSQFTTAPQDMERFCRRHGLSFPVMINYGEIYAPTSQQLLGGITNPTKKGDTCSQ